MGIVRNIQELDTARCFICGKRLLILPVFKLTGYNLELWTHPDCAGTLRRVLENDLNEYRSKPKPISFD
jgi:hypothetical protein